MLLPVHELFAHLFALLALLGTPVAAPLIGRQLRHAAPTVQRRVFQRLAIAVACIGLDLGFLAAGILGLSCFRLRQQMLGITLGVVATLVLACGFLLGTVGFLGVMFIVGDTVPLYQTAMPGHRHCYVTTYGNATTSWGGYNVAISRHLPWIILIEMTSSRHRFEAPQFEPAEACDRAVSPGTAPATS